MRRANAYVKEAQRAFYEYVDIWHSKTRIDNPLLCEGDGPLYQMRDWYSQFYLDAADVRPSSVARKAFEMTIRDGGTPPALHHVNRGNGGARQKRGGNRYSLPIAAEARQARRTRWHARWSYRKELDGSAGTA